MTVGDRAVGVIGTRGLMFLKHIHGEFLGAPFPSIHAAELHVKRHVLCDGILLERFAAAAVLFRSQQADVADPVTFMAPRHRWAQDLAALHAMIINGVCRFFSG